MKNVIKSAALCSVLASSVITGCSKDSEEKIPESVTIKTPAGGFIADRFKTLRLSISTTLANGSWEWKVDGQTVCNDSVYYFISDKPGAHEVSITVSNGTASASNTATIQVSRETTSYSNRVAKLFDFQTAPGQFVNAMPMWEEGKTEAQMIARAESDIKGGIGVHLGAYGGYVVAGFDHAIMNIPGQASFRVLGNAFNNWAEPGIIEVAVDKNGNGLPDDEWYEIAGSEYNKPKTVKNYEITYYKPDESKTPVTSDDFPYHSDLEYIKWTDNKGGSGYIRKNLFHSQSYYPQWKGASITFKGTKISDETVVDQSGSGSYFVSPALEFGYADNWPNADEKNMIKLDWAVDKNGKPVKLSGVHFIRVYTGMLGDAGWLGEVSTEFMNIEDLNLVK